VLGQPRLYPVNWQDTWTVGVSPHDQPLFVSDGAKLRIVDPDTYAVRDELTLPQPVWAVHLSPDGTRAYVQTGPTTVTPVDLRTKQPAGDITLPGRIESFTITSEGRRLVALTAPGTVSVLDLTTGAARSAPLGVDAAGDLEVSPDGHRGYVSTWAVQPALAEVDLDRLLVTAIDIPLDPADDRAPRANSPQLSPDGRWLYATAARAIVVLDTTTNAVRRRIPERGGTLGNALALAPNGRYLYACTEQGELRVIDLSTNQQVSTAKASGAPRGNLAVSEDGRKLYLVVKDGLDIFDTSAFS
jgi:DNA-binding beta-propeller fold protein YncE